jgi:hypothetical protein
MCAMPLGPNNLLSLGLFQPGPEVDFSLPSNVKIKTAYCAAVHTLRHTSSRNFTDEQAQICITSNVDIIIIIIIIITTTRYHLYA